MFVFVLVLLLMTPAGPRVVEIDAPSRTQCEQVAFNFRHGGRPAGMPADTRILDAYCVQQYET